LAIRKGQQREKQLVHFGQPVIGELVEVEPIDYAIVKWRCDVGGRRQEQEGAIQPLAGKEGGGG